LSRMAMLLANALTLHKAGRLAEAEEVYKQVLDIQSDQFDSLHLLGVILLQRGDPVAAVKQIDCALKINSNDVIALNNRGNAMHALQRFDEALASYDRALVLRPDYADALCNRGAALHELKRYDEALAASERIIALQPDYAEAHSNRGNTLRALGRYDEAVEACDRALVLRPDYADALCNRGATLHELKRYDEALADWSRIIALQPEYAEAHSNRGNTLRALGRYDEAVEACDRALVLRPDLADAYVNMGSALRDLGHLREAQETYLEALRLDPNLAGVYVNLADSKTFVPGDPHLSAMQALAAKAEGLSKTDRMQLDFALGKAHADLKDYSRSFKHLLAGNAARRETISYDENAAFALFDEIETVFTRELIAKKSGCGDPSTLPIFVIGMPRSGTTLIEQIIASHPQVRGVGELQTLNEAILTVRDADGNTIHYPQFVPALNGSALRQIAVRYVTELRALATKSGQIDSAFVTDKMPSNYFFVGLIHLVLPNAKIVHTVRDPIDTCVSCFSKLFSGAQTYTYNLGELGRYYRRYERLMGHWYRVLPADRILDVRYEDVVADLEGQARRIIAHCGLPWNDGCLSFHKTDRPIRTASATQVRQPIYTNAVGRWRAYEEHLGPLLTALGIANLHDQGDPRSRSVRQLGDVRRDQPGPISA
jgi:tetratricopeptide (TPR) repeat protein